MNPEQIRARLAEISAALKGIEDAKSDEGYSADQINEINGLTEEFEGLSTQLEAAEKLAATQTKATSSAGRKTGSSEPRVQVGANLATKVAGFPTAGEWLMAVKKAGQNGEVDSRLKNAAMKESVGEDGGFLVPEEISSAILKKMEGDESLMSRTNAIQVGGNSLVLNVDENQPWNGGVQSYWTAEGASITESKPNFKQAQFRLQKLAALVKATDELLDDATALESYIKSAAPNAIVHQVNKAILTGNGVGKPVGILNSAFTVTQTKESGQAADTVVAANILNMYARMFPSSRSNAAWYINPAVEPQLLGLKNGAGDYIYLSPGGQMNATPYGLLLGRPVIPLMGGMPAIGDVGDIVFADLSYYYMIRKAAGVKSATSIHLHFDKEITSFRFSLRLDGKCPFQSPVTTEFGSYQMSAFINLEAR
ncbi:phage major capsid protein [Candidatus Dojkabacteria bacterium]|uniref:Phage major capsid protein n=1 Tax=Candidatus Dojkabacteria bacterium TaxID=2099670 RepID=A0A5C7J933_9BACT|nr:MAG: phage major capsid protein [Candidatus Dojkabacteria bacterium]